MSSLYYGSPATHVTWIGMGDPAPKPRDDVRGRTPLLTDAQILEMRALDQFAGWGRRKLQRRFGVNEATVKRYLSGLTRAKLVATRKHLPQDLEAA